MNKFLSTLFLFLSLNIIHAENIETISVKLFSNYKESNAILSVKKGDYYLIARNFKGQTIDTIAKINSKDNIHRMLYIGVKSGRITLKNRKIRLGRYGQIYFKAADNTSSFTIKYGNKKERVYDGSLFIRPNDKSIEIINSVNIQSYIAGVVESEIGNSGNLESYKVQAILARTYALKNFNKFISEGYNLTDDVRSQVYFSKCYFAKSKTIHKAVELTKNKIIVEEINNNIIDPVFHANSGGQTMNAHEVWVFNIPYLQSIKDPYSASSKTYNSTWKVEIPLDKYLQFFYSQAPKLKGNSNYKKAILSFKQKNRMASFSYNDVEIPLIEIRSKFKLRSTYFNVTTKNNKVILSGRGHGHGVGLSQIGAINMAKKGFTYDQVIKFYFKGVSVIDLNDSALAFNK